MARTALDVRPMLFGRRLLPVLTRTRQCALLLEATAGYDGLDDRQLGAPLPHDVAKYHELVLASRGAGLTGLKVGVLIEGFMHKSLDPEVETCVRQAIDKLRELGAEIVDVSVPLCALSLSLANSPSSSDL